MDKKTKIKVIFLNIITFGYFQHCVNKKVKSQDKNEIKKSTKIPFNVDDLIIYLGTSENIKNIESSLNTLQVFFNDKSKIDINKIKTLGAKGTMFSKDKLSIVFGDFSDALKEEINKKIK